MMKKTATEPTAPKGLRRLLGRSLGRAVGLWAMLCLCASTHPEAVAEGPGGLRGGEKAPQGVEFATLALEPLGGKIEVPKDWYFKGGMTKTGFLYIASKEDSASGPYQTGFRIQGVIDVESRTKMTAGDFIRHQLGAAKVKAKKVLATCEPSHAPPFEKSCLETIEEMNTPDGVRDARVVYSFFWSDKLDMVVVTIFGAPAAEWAQVEPIYRRMGQFTLIDMEKLSQQSTAGATSTAGGAK